MRHVVLVGFLLVGVAAIALVNSAPQNAGAQTPPAVTGKFASAPAYSTSGDATVVFLGGTVAQLEAAAREAKASGVWVQDAAGRFNLMVVGGPAFVNDVFAGRFPNGIPVGAVTLRRAASTVAELYPDYSGRALPDVLFLMRTRLNALSANESLQVVSLARPWLDHIVAKGENVRYLGSAGPRLFYADRSNGEGTPVFREDGDSAGAILMGTVPEQSMGLNARISPSGTAIAYSGGGYRYSPAGEIIEYRGAGVHLYDFDARKDTYLAESVSGGCMSTPPDPAQCRSQGFDGWSADGRYILGSESGPLGSSWRLGPLPALTREVLSSRISASAVSSGIACFTVFVGNSQQTVQATGQLTTQQLATVDLSTGQQRAVPTAPTSGSYEATNFASCTASSRGALAIRFGAPTLGRRAIWLVDETGTPLFAPKVVELQPLRWLPDGSGVVAVFVWSEGDRNLTTHRDYFLVRRDGSVAKLDLPDAQLVDILPAS